ncbi:YciI family protein [uncultured Leptotrichia sp.]|uniref:YciI family protein n=1 Tax=uncultured Leptotrichia sp. TaxID=159271 RepID=UPI00261A5D78|nr:YciI family protein [uncultured Leptotrichia sp.]
MYIVSLNYIKEVSEVEKYLEEHVKFLEKYYEMEKFICSGRKNPRTGGVILLNAESLAEVESIILEDPFNANEIAEYEITEFFPTKYNKNFKIFVE